MTFQLEDPQIYPTTSGPRGESISPIPSSPPQQKAKLTAKIGKLFGVGASTSAVSNSKKIRSPLVSPTASPRITPSPTPSPGLTGTKRAVSPTPLALSSENSIPGALHLSHVQSAGSVSLKSTHSVEYDNGPASLEHPELSHSTRLFSFSNLANSIRSPSVSRQNSTKQMEKKATAVPPPSAQGSRKNSFGERERKNSVSERERKNSVSERERKNSVPERERKNSVPERERNNSVSDRKSSVGSDRKSSVTSIGALLSSVIPQSSQSVNHANKSATSLSGSESKTNNANLAVPPTTQPQASTVSRSSSFKRILSGKKGLSPKPTSAPTGTVATNPNGLTSIPSNNSQSNGNLLEQENKQLPSISAAISPPSLSSIGSPPLQPASNVSSATTLVNKPRFKMHADGGHEHNLKYAKRQEKLSNMLKDFLGAKKLRDEAKSALPNILNGSNNEVNIPSGPNGAPAGGPPTLFAGLVKQVKNRQIEDNTSAPDSRALAGLWSENGTNSNADKKATNAVAGAIDCRSFLEKYGRCQEVIGKGSFGVVRVAHKKVGPGEGANGEEILYAVKEFKRRANEGEKKYHRRLTSEFCISSSLKHLNIIDTLDLLKDAKGDYCEVMEYCGGGDLFSVIIAAGKLEYAEADCFFKQLIRGVVYMHEMGVSHRDLKPENLLLTTLGVLKITDFGNGECFKMAWESDIQLSGGVCGSSPYIAPEEFIKDSFDPRCVDIWACGVIYMAMRTGRQLWQVADPMKDEFYEEYLLKRKEASGYEPIENLKRARCRNVIYSILDPLPERRITGKQILNSEWGREIKVCDAGEGNLARHDSKLMQ